MSEGSEWQSTEAAKHYQRIADLLIPGRKDILSLIARSTDLVSAEPLRILDLGCGYGDVTAEILHAKPSALVDMVDFSDEMLRLSTGRFKANKNINVIKHDLNDGTPPGFEQGRFDIVVSCFAIHHVELSNRKRLYSHIRTVLKEDGLFINGDRFKGDSPTLDQWEFDNWISWMVQQIKDKLGKDKTFDEVKQMQIASDKKLGDKPDTLWNVTKELQQAGFRHVDCQWKFQNLAMLSAANR